MKENISIKISCPILLSLDGDPSPLEYCENYLQPELVGRHEHQVELLRGEREARASFSTAMAVVLVVLVGVLVGVDHGDVDRRRPGMLLTEAGRVSAINGRVSSVSNYV